MAAGRPRTFEPQALARVAGACIRPSGPLAEAEKEKDVAEIRIERKPARSWSWLIVALLLILLVWSLSALLGPQSIPRVRDGAAPVGALPQPHPAPAAEAPSLPRDRHAGPDPARDAAPNPDQEEALLLRSRVTA
jgi:hypothetical protein